MDRNEREYQQIKDCPLYTEAEKQAVRQRGYRAVFPPLDTGLTDAARQIRYAARL